MYFPHWIISLNALLVTVFFFCNFALAIAVARGIMARDVLRTSVHLYVHLSYSLEGDNSRTY